MMVQPHAFDVESVETGWIAEPTGESVESSDTAKSAVEVTRRPGDSAVEVD